jgi:hypothetical protein
MAVWVGGGKEQVRCIGERGASEDPECSRATAQSWAASTPTNVAWGIWYKGETYGLKQTTIEPSLGWSALPGIDLVI